MPPVLIGSVFQRSISVARLWRADFLGVGAIFLSAGYACLRLLHQRLPYVVHLAVDLSYSRISMAKTPNLYFPDSVFLFVSV